MIILGINTASICEVNLQINEKITTKKLEGTHQSENLINLIDEVLSTNNIEASEINEIAVNIGPGSFTGIRVGIATARTMAQILGIKIKPVTSFLILKQMYKHAM